MKGVSKITLYLVKDGGPTGIMIENNFKNINKYNQGLPLGYTYLLLLLVSKFLVQT